MAGRGIARDTVVCAFLGAWVILALRSATTPAATAVRLGLHPADSQTVLLGCFAVASGLLLTLAGLLIHRLWRAGREVMQTESRLVSGTVMVEFTLVMPIVLLIMGMVVQLALLANASLVVHQAAFKAARSAIVQFERDQFFTLEETINNTNRQNVEQAAILTLCALSPRTSGTDPGAFGMRRIFQQQNGMWGDRNFHRRHRYAQAATTVTIEDSYPPVSLLHNQTPSFGGFGPTSSGGFEGGMGNLAEMLFNMLFSLPFTSLLQNPGINNFLGPKQVDVTVTYDFLITIPGISLLPGITKPAPAGVSGSVFTIEQTVRLQSTGARVAHPIIFLGGDPRP